MTKMYDWDRFQSMSSRQKADVTTESTFSEQREQDEEEKSTKDIGLKKMEDEVKIEWPEDEEKSKLGKSHTINHDDVTHVYIVRHGKTDLNGSPDIGADRIRGWLDIPLNKQGEKEAIATANELKGKKISAILTSDLKRCIKTSEILAKHLGIKEIRKERAFRPWNMGDLQGQVTADILGEMKHHVIHPDEIVPGGECFNAFVDRYIPALEKAMDEAKKSGESLIIVSHYRNLEIAKDWMIAKEKGLKINLNDLINSKDIRTGGILTLSLDVDKWEIDKPESDMKLDS